jgi:hypothetical protein
MSAGVDHHVPRRAQVQAQAKMFALLEQWLQRRCEHFGPPWREALVQVEGRVERGEIVLRAWIPGVDGADAQAMRDGSAMRDGTAMLDGTAVYVVAHRADRGQGPAFALRELRSGEPIRSLPVPRRVTARQIAAVQRSDKLEIRMPAGGPLHRRRRRVLH